MPTDDSRPRDMSAPAGGGRPELIVVVKPEAGLRARAKGVISVTGADTKPLASLLETHGARMQPLFGLSEDRLLAQAAAFTATAEVGDTAEALPDLSVFYRVAADASRLEDLARQLLEQEPVAGAYIKPAGEPPTES